MNIALILSTLIIGASTNMPGDSSHLLSPQFAPPTSDLPLPPIQDKTTAPQTKTKSRSALRDAQNRNTQRTQSKSSQSSSGRGQQQNAQDNPPMMPMAPTDSSAGQQVGQSYQWLPPTANAGSGGGASGGLNGPSGVPSSPTRARPGEAQSYTSGRNLEQQNRRMQAARNAAATSPAMTPKPFTGTAQQSSGVSPYMNLFRTGNANGAIDNYSTLVRPELEQRRANQEFGSDIHGLENSNRVQGLNIRQLNRETQGLQGVNATQYFMNYGDYYKDAR